MEVDKTKLTELLVAMCHRAMAIGDNLICSDIYNKQCQTYLGERYGKCPPDCRTSKKRRWTHTANAATARKSKNCLNN